LVSAIGPRLSRACLFLQNLVSCSPVFIQCFMLTLLAEWGDRSQIVTINLAASANPIGVALGGIVGHSLCTGIAVLGSKALAKRIPERYVAIFGGLTFLVFAIHHAYRFILDDTNNINSMDSSVNTANTVLLAK